MLARTLATVSPSSESRNSSRFGIESTIDADSRDLLAIVSEPSHVALKPAPPPRGSTACAIALLLHLLYSNSLSPATEVDFGLSNSPQDREFPLAGAGAGVDVALLQAAGGYALPRQPLENPMEVGN